MIQFHSTSDEREMIKFHSNSDERNCFNSNKILMSHGFTVFVTGMNCKRFVIYV